MPSSYAGLPVPPTTFLPLAPAPTIATNQDTLVDKADALHGTSTPSEG
jgi:hypothetical protein